jgi:Rrf2 family protein
MKISNKADYALHAMLYLSALDGRRVASINEIAEIEAIPREYLAKILKELTMLGFIRSQKGIYGGYRLARPRKELTFLQVIEGIDGPLEPANCTRPDGRRPGHRKGKCPATGYFETIKKGLRQDLGAINFGDIPYEKFYPTAGKAAR